jgi:tyrosine-protein phosphatase SIW14
MILTIYLDENDVVKGESEPPTPDGTGLPPNFHEVLPGLYRSSYPMAAHFDKLREFGFKTIV